MSSPAAHPHARLTSIRKWIAGALAMVLALAVGFLTTTTSHAAGQGSREWCPSPGDYPGIGQWGPGDWLATDNAPALFVGGNLVSSNMEHEGLTVVYGNATFTRTNFLGVVGLGSGIVPSEGEAVLRVAGDVHLGDGSLTSAYLHITEPSHTALIGGTYSYTGTAPKWALDPVTDKLQGEAIGPWTGIDGAVTEISGNLAAAPGSLAHLDTDNPRILHLPGNGTVGPEDMTFIEVDGAGLGHIETLDFTGIPTGNGPIVVNVRGADIDWTPAVFTVDGVDITDPKEAAFGNFSSRIIWNFYEAQTLDIHSTNQVLGSILVPDTAAKVVSNPSTNGRFYVNGDLTLTSLSRDGSTVIGMEHHNYPWMLRAWPGQCEEPSTAPLRIPFTKMLTGDDPAGLDPDEVFEFTLTPDDPAGIKIGSTRVEISVAELIAAGDSGVLGHFVDWGFTEAHSPYTLTLAETGGTNPHIGYDGTEYTVTVTVVRDLAGNLQPTLRITKVGDPDATDVPAVFTNNVDIPSATVDLPVTKALGGGPTDKDYTFSFDYELAGEYGSAITLPDPATATGTVPAGSEDWVGKTSLSGIVVTEPGQYDVTITEQDAKEPGIRYSKEEITATITADLVNREWVTSVEYAGGSGEQGDAFLNTYRDTLGPPVVEGVLEVAKLLDADDGMPESTFEFTVAQRAADPQADTDLHRAAMPQDATAKITLAEAGGGRATFYPITFDQPGTYTFAMTETKGDVEGMTYDDRTVIATVKVDEEGDGLAVASITYADGAGDKHNAFTNTWAADGGDRGHILARTIGGSSSTSTPTSTSFPLARTGATILGAATAAGALILIGAALAYQRRRENGDF